MKRKVNIQEDIVTKYVKFDQDEHVLKRPDMYIGSILLDKTKTWTCETNEFVYKEIEYSPGLYKIFDEVLVNAIDHSIRLKSQPESIPVKDIRVNIDMDTGIIEIFNSGSGIDVVVHPEYGIYIPELIFGNLLTSSNYDDTEERTIGGRNGIGSKLANIFSEFFEIDTIDSTRNLRYTQRFESNMSIKGVPVIKKYVKKPYTSFRFKPDYVRFGVTSMSVDMYSLLKKRVYDVCATTETLVSVFFNNEKLQIKDFQKYCHLYLDETFKVSYEKSDDGNWEVLAAYSPVREQVQDSVSFVNGIWTLRGGKHVDYISEQICRDLTTLVVKRHKLSTEKNGKKCNPIPPSRIKNNLLLFVKATIVNPTFEGQLKESLTTPSSKFGSSFKVSDKFIEKVYKSGIVDILIADQKADEIKTLVKTDGKKSSTIRGIPKLEDANWAGTKRSSECTLILTEGDSAKSMAVAGLSVVGRDKYGVFPLRGKVMNVRDVSVVKLTQNQEISNLKKILGLETGKEYKNVESLRYGKIMIMSDQDCDGFHITALVFNLFYTLWPSLCKIKGFLTSLSTPILKVFKGTKSISFYSETEYENWTQTISDLKKWTVKYYKGLGTSDAKEAKEYFKQMKQVHYYHSGSEDDDFINLAFDKKRADDRKKWLTEYDRQNVLDHTKIDVTFGEFINKRLIHFSIDDISRSIPSIMDGLKPAQRKILYCCFKRNLTSEIKVAQLAGYVSEHSGYHHGEASLHSTITDLAQNYVGSNNINLLEPRGQFGTRLEGGKDSAAPRYIFTQLEKIVDKIYKKQDSNILKYLQDDGGSVEPEYYVPIIPMALVNGCLGIGTGYSTNIPMYNPKDLIDITLDTIKGKEIDLDYILVPWVKGFTGEIRRIGEKWISFGKWKIKGRVLEILELPLGTWTVDYKETLESVLEIYSIQVKSWTSQSTDDLVSFTITFNNVETVDTFASTIEENGYSKLENIFKLYSPKMLGTTNMTLFDSQGIIRKYTSPMHIIKEYYNVRAELYESRRLYIIKQLTIDLSLLQTRRRFVSSIVNGELIVSSITKKELEMWLDKNEFGKEQDSFDYLTRTPVYNLTKDKIKELDESIKKVSVELNEIQNTKALELWTRELNELKSSL
jgi:DNA topoisomerase-2